MHPTSPTPVTKPVMLPLHVTTGLALLRVPLGGVAASAPGIKLTLNASDTSAPASTMRGPDGAPGRHGSAARGRPRNGEQSSVVRSEGIASSSLNVRVAWNP